MRVVGVNPPTSGAVTMAPRTIMIDGIVWQVPEWESSSAGDFKTIVYGHETERIYVNGTRIRGEQNFMTRILVNLSGSSYAAMGLNNASGSAVSANNGGYQAGILLYPDGANIICPYITNVSGTYSGNVLPYDVLKVLLDGGCRFLPALGYRSGSGTWDNGGLFGYFLSTKRIIDSTIYVHGFNGDGVTLSPVEVSVDNYHPVLLVRTVE